MYAHRSGMLYRVYLFTKKIKEAFVFCLVRLKNFFEDLKATLLD